jgi:hypothetical protein
MNGISARAPDSVRCRECGLSVSDNMMQFIPVSEKGVRVGPAYFYCYSCGGAHGIWSVPDPKLYQDHDTWALILEEIFALLWSWR